MSRQFHVNPARIVQFGRCVCSVERVGCRSMAASTVVALASLVVWFGVYSRLQAAPFYDESSHVKAVRAIAAGSYQLHPELPTFPGYHWIAYIVSWPFGVSLAAARLTSLGFAMAGVVLYTLVRYREYGPDPYAPLRFAWLPLLFPFTAMAYTDVSSVVLVLGAVWAVSRGRTGESALWLAAACAVQQTNVVWAVFLAGWVALDAWPMRSLIVRRTAGYAAVAIGCAVVFAVLGRVQAYPVGGQQVMLNLNHGFVLAPLVLVLWLPAWVSCIPDECRRLRRAVVNQQPRAGFATIAVTGVGAWLVYDYGIVHQGNTFTGYFVRNEPLLWMQDSVALRTLGVVLAVMALYLLARLVWTQPDRWRLFLVSAIGVVSIAPLGPVEPRYYLVPAVLFGLFSRLPTKVEQRLVVWQGVLCLLMIVVIAHDWLW